jgi:hypothetical protein
MAVDGGFDRPYRQVGREQFPVPVEHSSDSDNLVYQNLSRLATQWEESVNGALWSVEKEAGRRLDELMSTVERLVESGSNERAPQLRADLACEGAEIPGRGHRELIRYLSLWSSM